jgi:hypothetical protein
MIAKTLQLPDIAFTLDKDDLYVALDIEVEANAALARLTIDELATAREFFTEVLARLTELHVAKAIERADQIAGQVAAQTADAPPPDVA